MRISDWSSDVCSSDLRSRQAVRLFRALCETAAAPGRAGSRDPRRAAERQADDRRGDSLCRDAGPEAAVEDLRGRGKEGRRRLVGPYADVDPRSEEHTSELQSLMRISYAVFCLKKKQIDQEKKT